MKELCGGRGSRRTDKELFLIKKYLRGTLKIKVKRKKTLKPIKCKKCGGTSLFEITDGLWEKRHMEWDVQGQGYVQVGDTHTDGNGETYIECSNCHNSQLTKDISYYFELERTY